MVLCRTSVWTQLAFVGDHRGKHGGHLEPCYHPNNIQELGPDKIRTNTTCVGIVVRLEMWYLRQLFALPIMHFILLPLPFRHLKPKTNTHGRRVGLWVVGVVAIPLSDIASKTDEIFSCKKAHYTCRQLLVIYICNKSTNKETSQYASTTQ